MYLLRVVYSEGYASFLFAGFCVEGFFGSDPQPFIQELYVYIYIYIRFSLGLSGFLALGFWRPEPCILIFRLFVP